MSEHLESLKRPMPCATVAFNRIAELGSAIHEHGLAEWDVESIENWAEEILVQCALIKDFRNV